MRAKATGEVLENPATGQLTAHFEGDPLFENDPRYSGNLAAQFLPQTPFEDVELHFFGGDRAPLVTPTECGAYTTTGTFTPWSETGTVESSSTFDITSGPDGRPCQSPAPFDPTLTTGTTSIQAGGFSPFVMTMSREDGEQNLQAVTLKMPLGISGTLSSVKLCGEEQANAGTCGAESEVGETIVSVGVGGDPFTVRGRQGVHHRPLQGRPVRPVDRQSREGRAVRPGESHRQGQAGSQPGTAAITVTTDDSGPYKIPTIIDGIPLQIRHVFVNINRPNFTFNATNCNPLQVTGELLSTQGTSSTLKIPYQATNCAVLAFSPKLAAKTSGKATRANGTSLNVKLGYAAGPTTQTSRGSKSNCPRPCPPG